MLDSREYWKEYIEKGGDLEFVPPKFVTEEMCKIYMDNGGRFASVPFTFLTEEMCLNHLIRCRRINDVPERFRKTQTFWDKYISLGESLNFVPKEFITRQICDEYIAKGGNLCFVPKEFITRQMCDEYIARGGSLDFVPKEFMTKEMCDEYIAKGGSLDFVPKEFINLNMLDMYIKINRKISLSVLMRFSEEELINFFKQSLKLISIDDVNDKIAVAYIKSGGKLSVIPNGRRTRAVYEALFQTNLEKGLVDINVIPRDYRTSEMYDAYFENEKTIVGIPTEFITEKMADYCLENGVDLDILPEEYMSLKMLEVKKALYRTLQTDGTKKSVLKECNVPMTIVDKALADIESEDLEIYQALEAKFDEHSDVLMQKMISDIIKLKEIILSLGEVKGGKIPLDKQIQFIYLICKYHLEDSLLNIYKFIKLTPIDEDLDMVVSFLHRVGYREQVKKNSDPYAKEETSTCNGESWIWKYDIDKEFGPNQRGNIPMYKFMSTEGEIIEIDKEKASSILDILEGNGIPTRNCIVKEAFRRYARGELNDFMEEILSFDCPNLKRTESR